MCNETCKDFFSRNISQADIKGRRILEVGSYDVNGSLRKLVMELNPSSYIGIDIEKGPGVDEVCDITGIIYKYGKNRFDVVICTEVVEHVYDWRAAFRNLKGVLSPSGIIILSTRSRGFGIHGFPSDCWRFELDDMKTIFKDMKIRALESDISSPGIFIIAEKVSSAENWIPAPDDFNLYSVITGKRCNDVSEKEKLRFEKKLALRRRIASFLPLSVKDFLKRHFKI